MEDDVLQERNKVTETFFWSKDLDKIFLALSKSQGVMGSAKKDSENPFFKSSYADLASCWDVARKPLSDNGLTLIQLPGSAESAVKLKSVLGHSSGQYIGSDLTMKPSKNDPQGIGSCLTYMRRYAMCALVGIAPEDDDGNGAREDKKISAPRPQTNTQVKKEKSSQDKADTRSIVTAFAKFNISKEEIEKDFGKKLEKFTKSDRVKLKGNLDKLKKEQDFEVPTFDKTDALNS